MTLSVNTVADNRRLSSLHVYVLSVCNIAHLMVTQSTSAVAATELSFRHICHISYIVLNVDA